MHTALSQKSLTNHAQAFSREARLRREHEYDCYFHLVVVVVVLIVIFIGVIIIRIIMIGMMMFMS